MMRTSAVSVLILGLLSACGHTPEERLVSGALLGAAAGAFVGIASDPHLGEHHRSERRYEKRRYREHRGHGGYRRHRDYDRYDDYGDCCYD